jgi:FixJ family two-component response regulator
VVQAMQSGVLDYVTWPIDEGELAAILGDAEEKGRSLTSARLREANARSRIQRLSEREREVLGCVASGLSNDLIARRLGISSRTVEIHRAKMLNKIGASHTSEAIRIAIEAALIP